MSQDMNEGLPKIGMISSQMSFGDLHNREDDEAESALASPKRDADMHNGSPSFQEEEEKAEEESKRGRKK